MYLSASYDQQGNLIQYAPPEFCTDPICLAEVKRVMQLKASRGGDSFYTQDGHLQCVPDVNGLSKALAGEPPTCMALRHGRRIVVDVTHGMLETNAKFWIEQLFRMGWIVWITAFIGPESHDGYFRRRNAAFQAYWQLSIHLGFDPKKHVLTPRTDGLYHSWVEEYDYDYEKYWGGMGALMRVQQTPVLFSSNKYLCTSAVPRPEP